jgi:hypothetical protein
MNLTHDRTAEIQREIADLNSALKMSVQKAIRIGELLTEQKEIVGHGLFLSWLKDNIDISERSAQMYMKLFSYKDKTAEIADLQSAYRQIETIEAQAKKSKEERDRQLISEYRRTGTKPPGWDRSLDYRIQKDKEAESKQNERIEKEKKEREQRAKEYKDKQESFNQPSSNILTDAFQTVADAFIEKTNKRNAWKEKIRLSADGKESAFMDAIIDYMETLESDTRRIEACNNIIKICRNISVELQRVNTTEAA